MNDIMTTKDPELQHYIDENAKLRAKLLDIAKECSGCDGSGLVTVDLGKHIEACRDCVDIRELLD